MNGSSDPLTSVQSTSPSRYMMAEMTRRTSHFIFLCWGNTSMYDVRIVSTRANYKCVTTYELQAWFVRAISSQRQSLLLKSATPYTKVWSKYGEVNTVTMVKMNACQKQICEATTCPLSYISIKCSTTTCPLSYISIKCETNTCPLSYMSIKCETTTCLLSYVSMSEKSLCVAFRLSFCTKLGLMVHSYHFYYALFLNMNCD